MHPKMHDNSNSIFRKLNIKSCFLFEFENVKYNTKVLKVIISWLNLAKKKRHSFGESLLNNLI
jgi:hypothetical protein